MSIRETATQAPPLPTASAAPEARFRSEMGQISRHSAVFFLGTLFTAAAGYFFKLYVARKLGASALGTYTLGMTVVALFGLVGGLGLPQAAVKFVAAYAAKEHYERLHVFLRCITGVFLSSNIALALVMLFAGPWIARSFYHAPDLVPYVGLFALILVISGAGTFLGQLLAGYRDVARRTVITNFVGSPLNILVGVVLLAGGMGLRGYIWAQIASGLVVFLLLAANVWKLTPVAARQAPSVNQSLGTEVVWFSVAVFGMNFLEFLLGQTDKIFLGVFLDVRDVGIYAVAGSLVAFVPIALQSVNQIFSPTIADLHARGERELLGRIFQTLTKWVLGFTLPLAFVMIVFSKALMRLFGPGFEAGWIVLVIGTLGQLVNTGVGSVGYLLLMSGNQKRLVRVQVGAAIFMLTVTVILVKPLGMLGVALSSALTNILTNYLCLIEVNSALQLSPYNRTYARMVGPEIGGLAAVGGVYLLSGRILHEWILIVLALVASYGVFVSFALLFGLDSDDRMIVAAIQRRLTGAAGKVLLVPE